MKETKRAKRLEVTGVSYDSIANIVSEIENGSLTIPDTAFDQVNNLRQFPLFKSLFTFCSNRCSGDSSNVVHRDHITKNLKIIFREECI